MRAFPFLFMIPVLGILLVSGCTGSNTGDLASSVTGDASSGADGTQQESGMAAPAQVPVEAGSQDGPQDGYLEVTSVETDKDLYHSAEVMKLASVITAESEAPGTVVTVTGINGKMSLSKTVDLAQGDNAVGFEYTLPRCNVCGGIREGNYTCTLSASYGGASSSGDFSVEIKQ